MAARRPLPVGARFGMLVVFKNAPPRNAKSRVVVRCECGTQKEVDAASLLNGHTQSCGCRNLGARGRHARTYRAWRNMMDRVRGVDSPKLYAQRGITVCERWLSFDHFLEDMGVAPGGMTLDRQDTNGNYEPSNCRWATPLEQGQNTRRSRVWVVDGVEYPSAQEAANALGVGRAAIRRMCEGYESRGKVYPPKAGCSAAPRYQENAEAQP